MNWKNLLNLLRQPKKDLMNTCISTNFDSCSTTRPKVIVSFILQHFVWNRYPIPLQALELHRLSWLSPFSKAFVKIYYFLNFHCYIVDPSNMTGCSIFTFLANFNIFWTTNVLVTFVTHRVFKSIHFSQFIPPLVYGENTQLQHLSPL